MFGLDISAGYALLVIALGLLPWIIAATRNHPQRGAIVAMTVFGGWTGIGWLVALVWACWNYNSAADGERQPIP